MVTTIVVIVVIVGLGVSVLAYRNRPEKGIESGISSFRRELHALAPRPDDRPIGLSAPSRPTDRDTIDRDTIDRDTGDRDTGDRDTVDGDEPPADSGTSESPGESDR